MKSVSDWLPLPLWLIVVMFVVGAGIGLALGFMLSSAPAPPAQERPWDDRRAKIVAPETPKAAEKSPAAADTKTPDNTETASQDAKPLPPKDDPHWLNNLSPGPVKRAIEGALSRIKPKIVECHTDTLAEHPELPPRATLRLLFEAVGSMATLLEAEALGGIAGDVAWQDCIITRVKPMLLDFPVDDGNYEILVALDFAKPRKRKE